MGFKPFGERDVTESGIEMPSAGGGLHASLAVDQLELEHGDRVTIVLEAECTKVRFDPVDKDDIEDTDLRRVHVLKVRGAAQIDRKQVAEILADQARRVAEAAGVDELPFTDETPEVCPHDRPVGECTVCPSAEPEPGPQLAAVPPVAETG